MLTASVTALDLSDNTNLWGAPPAAVRAIETARQSDIYRYPTAYEPSLAGALADYVGVSANMIACGCGSDDVLDSAIRAFAEPGATLCLPDPSFSMIPVFARANGLVPVTIPLTASLDVDVDAMLKTRARITYLCSPNNPTGGALPRQTVEYIIERAAGLVIIDQAYVEFGGEDYAYLASCGRSVLITRTMSKAFGLAGVRLGYGIGSPDLVAQVLNARGPYKVNTLAERAALAVLDRDRPWVDERIAEVIRNRARLRSQLSEGGVASLESFSNFVLIPVDDCAAVARRLEDSGIRVRSLPGLTGIGDAIRISIGPRQMMQQFIDAFMAPT